MSSVARTIYLLPPPPGGVGPNGSVNGNVSLTWPSKAPLDTLDFSIDASAFLADLGGDTINAGTIALVITPTDLIASAPIATSTAITWDFSGGTATSPVTAYSVALTFMTLGGVQVSRQLWLPIAPNSPLPGAGGNVLIAKGTPGRGIASITQPSGPSTAVVTYTDTTTSNLVLPPGPTGSTGPAGQTGAPGPTGVTAVSLAVTGTTGPAYGTASLNGGTLALSLVPTVAPGPLNVTPQGTAAGTWLPASNSPSLATGGLLNGVPQTSAEVLTIGGSIGGTVTLGTPIDGITTAVQGDQIQSSGGSSPTWIYLPRTGATNTTQLTLPSGTWQNNGDGLPGLRLVDAAGRVYFNVDQTTKGLQVHDATIPGTLTASVGSFTTLNAPFSNSYDGLGNTILGINSTLGAGIVGGAQFLASDAGKLVFRNPVDGQVVGIMDFGTGALTMAGPVTGGGTSASSFGPSDFAAHNAAAQAYSASVMNQPNATAQRPSAAYNLLLSYGQSKGIGELGSPSITTTQPLDVLTIGNATRPQNLTAQYTNAEFSAHGTISYQPVGSSAFLPAVSVDQTYPGAITADKTGYVSGLGSVTAVVTNSGGGTYTGTYTWLAAGNPNVSTTLNPAIGDTIQMEGWTVATGNNALGSSNSTLNVTGYTSGTTCTLTVQDTFGVIQSTVSPESGISMAQVNYYNFGESSNVAMANTFRQNWLDAGRPSANKFVTLNGGVAGQTIANLSPGASPPLWNRNTSACTLTASLAGTNTVCMPLFDFNQGGSDAGVTADATYLASLQSLFASVNTTLTGLIGNTRPPIWLQNVVDGYQLTNGPDTNGVAMPVTHAQAAFCGLVPTYPYGLTSYLPSNFQPYSPNVYCAGTDYQVADHAAHLTANGYRQMGCYRGKILDRLFNKGLGWKPPHPLGVYYRGNQILVVCHIPSGQVAITAQMNKTQPVIFTTLGFTVIDNLGVTRTINSVTLEPSACVLISCGGGAFTGSPTVRYAGAEYVGSGNLSDTDSTVALENWSYTPGSGQVMTENFPNPITPTSPYENGQPYTLVNFMIPFSLVAAAG
jgi:hypothetical protein